MPNPKKTHSLNRTVWVKSRAKRLKRAKKPSVKIGNNCLICVYGAIPTNSNAKIKCSNRKADVVFNPNKRYWVCHSFVIDKRLS